MNEIKRLFDFPYYQLNKFPRENCFASKVDGNWVPISTQEYINKANLISLGLLKLGIKKDDKIAVVSSNNRPEWNIVDIGILQTGAVSVPAYPSISEEDNIYIFNDSKVKMCIASDKELYDKMLRIKDQVPTLEHVFIMDKEEGTNSWEEIMKLGEENEEAKNTLEETKDSISEKDLATLIYTSGTTGKPKGVMLSHQNIVSNVIASGYRVPIDNNSVVLSFLPLCHIFERMLIYLYQYIGVSVHYAESLETIGDNIREVKPHIFTAVPRLIEKVYARIINKGAELKGIKRALFFWAVKLGNEYELSGKSAFYNFKLKIARKLIFSKWQEALGGNIVAIVSGSAALENKLIKIFYAAGIPILEGYGLTETSPVLAVNSPVEGGVKFGTVGKAIKNAEIKIAEDGEILARGTSVTLGYYNNQEKTDEAIDKEGWFHTGDIGKLDSEGYLQITDRKKEIFKTSGGKYIAPQIMENKFKLSPFIEQIMVVGEFKKHPSALVVPNFEFLEEWCKRKDLNFDSRKEMVCDSQIFERIMEEIEIYNADFGKWERVKKICILDREWTLENGELTPTLKLKRKNVKANFQKEIDKLYEEN